MANKKKPLKKQKIRNSEYYDMQLVFDELYAASVKGQRFCNLVELIKRPENIKLAYRNIRKNSGSRTAGVDNKTISDLNKWNENALVAHVQRKLDWYIPNAVRRVEIPKDNGKTRPLGIPTIMDRLIQQCILQVLEPICEAKFFKRSNGFRPNHSAENAIAQAERMIQNVGCHYVIDIDIKSFFDNVNHGKLLKQMWTHGIRDKKLLSIISAMLKAEVAGIGFPEKGTPQGGIISPLFHVDYAFHKVSPGHYLLFFKANQADAITAAFQKYSAKVLNKEQDKASIFGQLRKFTEQIRTQAKEKQRTREAVKDGR